MDYFGLVLSVELSVRHRDALQMRTKLFQAVCLGQNVSGFVHTRFMYKLIKKGFVSYYYMFGSLVTQIYILYLTQTNI